MRLIGPVFAVLTPFDSGLGADLAAMDDYLAFLQERGVRNIVTGGTTGEFASLTLDERERILQRCRKVFSGTIINHISSCCYRDCWRLLDHSRGCADAVLLLPPFYYANAASAGCLEFFRMVLGRSGLPVFLYNFPEHTQQRIAPEALSVLGTEFACLAGIKDSGGDLEVSRAYRKAAAKPQVYVGGDRCALEVLTAGLDGTVTGGGNPVPEFLVRLHDRFSAGEAEKARRAQDALDGWTRFREGFGLAEIPLVKAALGARIPGFPPYARPPFLTAGQSDIEKIRAALIGEILPLHL